jgi:hypothetical protein
MATRFTEDREIRITAEERQEFLEELAAAMKARKGGSSDDELEALWDIAGTACGIFEVFEEDVTYQPSPDDLPTSDSHE